MDCDLIKPILLLFLHPWKWSYVPTSALGSGARNWWNWRSSLRRESFSTLLVGRGVALNHRHVRHAGRGGRQSVDEHLLITHLVDVKVVVDLAVHG